MTLKEGIKRSIKRSEKAYELYLGKKLYYQALRIFKANEMVYELLNEFIYECEEPYLDDVFIYIFHLEDWFESFRLLEKSKPALEDSFVFERLKESPAFPSGFIDNVLSE